MTQIGIQISSVRQYLQTPADVLASFRKVRQIGYRYIQIQWISPAVPVEVTAEALRETGLECVGTQEYYDVVVERLADWVAMNERWGGKYICVSGIPERYRSEEGCLAFAGELNALAAGLEQKGMILNFHPRAADVLWFGGKSSLEIIFEQTRAPFQFLLDVYHMVKAGLDPLEWIHRVQGRNDLIHFKDRKRGPDGKEVLVPVGQGEIHWGLIFQACAATGVKVAFAEQESWEKDPFECLRESYEYMLGAGAVNE